MPNVLDDELLPSLISELEQYWDQFCEELPNQTGKPQLSREQFSLCVAHLQLVLEANAHINLTRITEPHDAVILHLLDSLMLLPFISSAPSGALLDIGTGAGFPGLTLAIASGRPSTLLDSVGKKVSAVQSFISMLGVSNASALQERVEAFAVHHLHSYAVVVARAVAPLSVLLEYASPLLVDGGMLVVTKGIPKDDELSAASYAARLCGFSQAVRSDFSLPNEKGKRALFTYTKVKEAQIGLPRGVGVAKNHPLGF